MVDGKCILISGLDYTEVLTSEINIKLYIGWASALAAILAACSISYCIGIAEGTASFDQEFIHRHDCGGCHYVSMTSYGNTILSVGLRHTSRICFEKQRLFRSFFQSREGADFLVKGKKQITCCGCTICNSWTHSILDGSKLFFTFHLQESHLCTTKVSVKCCIFHRPK